MSIESPTVVRGTKFDWDHEIQVALPAHYGVTPERRYPVLWLTDGPMLFHLAVGLLDTFVPGGLAPEMIVVGVGSPSEAGLAEFSRRRAIEFCPSGASMLHDGPGAVWAESIGPKDNPPG